ncbi:hypothetical protein N825_12105 [Skermanella stibiiresistens SB22]|uniref:Terminase n=1 Tax=Skermanella stibiiresistens SB22 TaxID=1385369 RepID=W9H1F0_9PROT|nr:terminase small subunit [Skermanella stibiiresistens]EWY38547.1 hypothetical protein N825_12105 [Skermanella stibiiresistens SB22]
MKTPPPAAAPTNETHTAAVPKRPLLTTRQEEFCEAMSFGVGGAEAARMAGYSASGAKQRGAFLMRQPEIRVRIDEIRAARRTAHQAYLDEADEQVGWVIEDAFESKRPALALRAIEFRLRLRGVIQDKRIDHHHHGALDSHPHPDADLEDLPGDPDEDLDPIRYRPGYVPETPEPPAAEHDQSTGMMTYDDLPADFPLIPAPNPAPHGGPHGGLTLADLSGAIDRVTAEFSSLLDPNRLKPCPKPSLTPARKPATAA